MTDMELKDILAISGQPGLFRYVARSSNGVIVESLADGRRMNSSGTAKISALAGEVVPDYDRDRVHVSDMKKVVSWFNLLVGAGMTDFRLEKEDGTETDGEDGEKDEAAAE